MKDELMSFDTFVKQKVICFKGAWASRLSVIKYAGFVLAGIHPKKPPISEEEKVIDAMMHNVRYMPGATEADLRIDISGTDFHRWENSKKYDPHTIDAVLSELTFTARKISQADNIKRLEEYISLELRTAA